MHKINYSYGIIVTEQNKLYTFNKLGLFLDPRFTTGNLTVSFISLC